MASQNIRAPKLLEFYSIISDHELLLQYLRDLSIIDDKRNCYKCLHQMKLSRNSSKLDQQEWRCDFCLRVESIRQNSVFEKSKLSLRMQMEILYFFGTDLQIFEVEKFTDISHVTIIDWYKKLRHMCKLFLQKDPLSLGNAEGSIIEIDESLFGKKRKYNRGTGFQDTWVFGMKERGTRKVLFQTVERRNRDTLLPIIKSSVQQGCTIYSDCWKAYSTLEQEGYRHSTVNHSKQFIAQDGTCTNGIEGVWGLVKLKIKSMKGVLHDKIDAILDEFTYRHRYGLPNGDIYHRLMSDIANQNFELTLPLRNSSTQDNNTI